MKHQRIRRSGPVLELKVVLRSWSQHKSPGPAQPWYSKHVLLVRKIKVKDKVENRKIVEEAGPGDSLVIFN